MGIASTRRLPTRSVSEGVVIIPRSRFGFVSGGWKTCAFCCRGICCARRGRAYSGSLWGTDL